MASGRLRRSEFEKAELAIFGFSRMSKNDDVAIDLSAPPAMAVASQTIPL
jgi:hypothetical protein